LPKLSFLFTNHQKHNININLRLRLWAFLSPLAPDLLLTFDFLLIIFFEPLLGVLGVVGGAILS
jgi:hypothetical protein